MPPAGPVARGGVEHGAAPAAGGVGRGGASLAPARARARAGRGRRGRVRGGRGRRSTLVLWFLLPGGERHDIGLGASTAASEPLVLLGEREDHRVQHLRALFEVRVLPPHASEFLLELVAWTRDRVRAGARNGRVLFELPAELV